MKHARLLCITAALALLAGCQTAMDRRISAHQTTWRTLSPEDQHRLLQGRVRAGDTEEMVTIALGPPDRVLSVPTRGGPDLTVWLYDLWDTGGDLFLDVPTSPPHTTSREEHVLFQSGVVVNQMGIATESNATLRELQIRHTTEMMETRLDRLVALTPEQKAKAHEIFAQANTELYAFSPAERPAKGMPIRVKMRADIRALLTPEQQAKYDAAPQTLGGGSTQRQ